MIAQMIILMLENKQMVLASLMTLKMKPMQKEIVAHHLILVKTMTGIYIVFHCFNALIFLILMLGILNVFSKNV